MGLQKKNLYMMFMCIFFTKYFAYLLTKCTKCGIIKYTQKANSKICFSELPKTTSVLIKQFTFLLDGIVAFQVTSLFSYNEKRVDP